MTTVIVGGICFVVGVVVGVFGLCIYSLIQAASWFDKSADSEAASW